MCILVCGYKDYIRIYLLKYAFFINLRTIAILTTVITTVMTHVYHFPMVTIQWSSTIYRHHHQMSQLSSGEGTTVSYSKTGQENGQESQKAGSDDNNQLTDGEGPNNLNQEWCDRGPIKALTNWQNVTYRQTDIDKQTDESIRHTKRHQMEGQKVW